MKIMVDNILAGKGKTRYWLAQKTNITYQNIVKICNDKTTSMNFDVLEKLCAVLDCTPNDIFDIKKEHRP